MDALGALAREAPLRDISQHLTCNGRSKLTCYNIYTRPDIQWVTMKKKRETELRNVFYKSIRTNKLDFKAWKNKGAKELTKNLIVP